MYIYIYIYIRYMLRYQISIIYQGFANSPVGILKNNYFL